MKEDSIVKIDVIDILEDYIILFDVFDMKDKYIILINIIYLERYGKIVSNVFDFL